MNKSSHVLVCCDFDGTITLQDTGVILIDHCMGKERRVELDESVMRGELSLRQAFKEMWESVNTTFEEALELFCDVELDPKFKSFVTYCFSKEIPLVVVSGGPKFLIEHFLKRFFPEEHTKFQIESNYGQNVGRKWEFDFHDDSEHGHDKGLTMKKIQADYAASNSGAVPYTVFCGDGVSDLSAARHADLLFVRRGRGLEGYCQDQEIVYTAFDDFQVVLSEVEKLKGE